MKLRIFKVGDFSHQHERRAFRRIVKALGEGASDEPLFLIVNATLPMVTYHAPNGTTREYRGVNPDMLILKKDSAAVVEMKSHPGVIHFPNERERMWDPWAFEYEGKRTLMNEGGRSPLSQVDINCKAFQAFLEQYEERFADSETKDSNWHKVQKILLFTDPSSTFVAPVPPFWSNTHLATLEAGNSDFDFVGLVEDMTTPAREYRKDPRPLINLTETSIINIVSLLGAEPIEGDQILQPEKQEDADLEPSGYGFASMLSYGREKLAAFDEHGKVIFKGPDQVGRLPLPVRLVKYYSRCLSEEGKLSARLNMHRPTTFYAIEGIREPIFHGSGYVAIDDARIPDSFLQADVQLTYGFIFVIHRELFSGHSYLYGEPLFITDVTIKNDERGHVFSGPAGAEVLLNRSALKRFQSFAGVSEEELEEYVGSLSEVTDAKERIARVIKDVGLGSSGAYANLGTLDVSRITDGVFPAGIVFQSQGGMYQNTIRELEEIAKDWTAKASTGAKIDDAAWRLLSGVSSTEISGAWEPPLLSVAQTNYEQSQAAGLALSANVLQVVSGPPGTGKSQLIQNIIVNAHSQKRRILFGSKNNKAVDVVVKRLNKFVLGFPIVLRGGNQDERRASAEELSNLNITNVSPDEKKEGVLAQARLRQTHHRLTDLRATLDRYYVALERLESVQSQIETALDSHETLRAALDWYSPLPPNLGIEEWAREWELYGRLLKRANSFLFRLSKRSRMVGWPEIFSRESFVGAAKKQFTERCKQAITPPLLTALGPRSLLKGTPELLPVLTTLVSLNNEADALHRFVSGVSESSMLREWGEIEHIKVDDSRVLLTTDWRASCNPTGLNAAKGLLSGKEIPVMTFESATGLFSCCATTSLSVARNIPLAPCLFDAVVVDEASQSDIPSALPLLFRAKRAVIIGDEMQLRPIVLLDGETDRAIATAYGLALGDYGTFGYKNTSLLDLANDRFTRAGGMRVLLKNHYRSHPQIIDFSNRWFYDNQLRIMTEAEGHRGIEWHNVRGKAVPKWVNQAEVKAVGDLVTALLGRGLKQNDLGVVTPFRMQAQSIISELRRRGVFENGGGNITVSTAHGFQGDEREVMILSLAIAPEMPTGTIRWIHDSTTDSKNLLNVAITRARRELHVVGDADLCEKAGGLLRHFVSHARSCTHV